MTNTEFLHTYRERHAELRVLQRQLTLCGGSGRPCGAGTIDYARVMRATNAQAAADCQHYEGIDAAIAALQEQLDTMEPRFQELMQQARNYKERCILRFYYLQGLTDEYIAESLDISARHANRLRHQMLEHMDK